MAEQEQEPQVSQEIDEEEEDDNPNYKPPVEKSLGEIVNQDAEDESLVKYKKTLLGEVGGEAKIVVDESNPKKVIFQKLSLLVEGRDEVFLDLTKGAEAIKSEKFTIKEGCHYQIKFYFFVQHDIVQGLRYFHTVYRKGIRVDKMSTMMGSYGPKTEMHTFTTQPEEAPSGMMMRGDYKMKSSIKDDDKNVYLEWEWHLAVKKDW